MLPQSDRVTQAIAIVGLVVSAALIVGAMVLTHNSSTKQPERAHRMVGTPGVGDTIGPPRHHTPL